MDGWGEMAAMFGRFSKRGWETEALGVVEMGAEWVVSSVDRNMKDVETKSYPQTWLIFKDLHNTACCFCQGPHTNSPSFPCPGSTLLNPLVWQSWWTQVTTVVSDMNGWLIKWNLGHLHQSLQWALRRNQRYAEARLCDKKTYENFIILPANKNLPLQNSHDVC